MRDSKLWAFSLDDLEYHGPFYSLDRAKKAGDREARMSELDSYFIGKCYYPDLPEITIDDTKALTKSLESQMRKINESDVSGRCLSTCRESIIEELREELDKAFKKWSKKHAIDKQLFLVYEPERIEIEK